MLQIMLYYMIIMKVDFQQLMKMLSFALILVIVLSYQKVIQFVRGILDQAVLIQEDG